MIFTNFFVGVAIQAHEAICREQEQARRDRQQALRQAARNNEEVALISQMRDKKIKQDSAIKPGLPQTESRPLYDEEPEPYVTTEKDLHEWWLARWEYLPSDRRTYAWFEVFIERCKAGEATFRGRKIKLVSTEKSRLWSPFEDTSDITIGGGL